MAISFTQESAQFTRLYSPPGKLLQPEHTSYLSSASVAATTAVAPIAAVGTIGSFAMTPGLWTLRVNLQYINNAAAGTNKITIAMNSASTSATTTNPNIVLANVGVTPMLLTHADLTTPANCDTQTSGAFGTTTDTGLAVSNTRTYTNSGAVRDDFWVALQVLNTCTLTVGVVALTGASTITNVSAIAKLRPKY